ncbi:MAG: hypothetical protein ACJAYC_000194 [Halieaceae bacterium]|jgi:hypothetical protein
MNKVTAHHLAQYPKYDPGGTMAAIAFDTLKAARHLIEAGMPTRQAEAQAEVMAETFVFNVDSLVTKDYLDALRGHYQHHCPGSKSTA